MYNGVTRDSSVKVSYSGAGPTATVVFKIQTSSSYTNKNLNLGCKISSTEIAYSINVVAFTVIQIINPTKNSYFNTFNQNDGSMLENNLLVSNYFILPLSSIYLQSC